VPVSIDCLVVKCVALKFAVAFSDIVCHFIAVAHCLWDSHHFIHADWNSYRVFFADRERVTFADCVKLTNLDK
jgi:hypothetical protein